MDNSIRKDVTKGNIEVSRVYSSDFQKKNTLTAELKQKVSTTSYYPSVQIGNSLKDSIFETSEFNLVEQQFTNTETRVAWINIPTGKTQADVVQMLSNFPEATLYRILSNKPILADSDNRTVSSSDLPHVTLDGFADSQAVRYPKGHAQEGELALDTNGKIQYRRIGFSKTAEVDQDKRTMDSADFYASPSLSSEINEDVTTMQGQELS